jgi:membrane protein DedA with SNARE-associated domain
MGDGVWYNPMTWDGPWIWVWLALYFIVLCRAGGTHLIGRAVRNGVSRIKSIQRLLASASYQRAERLLDRWGPPAVTVSFLTIGFQTAINLASGVIRMRWYRYLPALLIGGALWATVYTTIGSVSISAIGIAYNRWPVPTIIVTVVLIILLVGWILWRLFAPAKQESENVSAS